MTVAALADSGLLLRYKLIVTLTAGQIVFTERNNSVTSAYPRIIEVSDIPEDSDDLQRIMVLLQQKGPYRVNGVDYWTLSEVFRLFSPMEVSAQLSVLYVNGVTSAERVLVLGNVVMIHHTQTTVRLEIEPRQVLERVKAPQRKIDSDLLPTDATRKVIPEASKGLTVPMIFGDPMPALPSAFSAMNRTAKIQRLLRYGIVTPTAFPSIELQREEIYSSFIAAEYIPGELTLPITALEQSNGTNPLSAMVWIPQTKSWGQIWSLVTEDEGGVSYETDYFNSIGYCYRVARQPYVIAPVRCVKWCDENNESDTVTDPKYAIDGKIETYAIITNAANDWVAWEVQPVSGLGHICSNSVDRGTAGGGDADNNLEDQAPAGLQVYAIVRLTGSQPTSGSLTIALKFPGVTQDTLFSETSYSFSSLLSAGMFTGSAAVIVHNLRVADPADGGVGQVGDGWYGTKFARGDFTGVNDPGADDTQLGSDLPLLHNGVDDTRPFRAAIKSTLDQPVGIIDIGMRIGFVHTQTTETFILRGALQKLERAGRDITGRRR